MGFTFYSSLNFQQSNQADLKEINRTFDKAFFEKVDKNLDDFVNVEVQDPKKIKKQFGIKPEEYFLTATTLDEFVVGTPDTIYVMKVVPPERLAELKVQNEGKRLYSLENKRNYSSESVSDVADQVYKNFNGNNDEKKEVIRYMSNVITSYPNPANSSSKILLKVPFRMWQTDFSMYNVLGQKIETFEVADPLVKGKHVVNYTHKRNLSSGIYFLRFSGINGGIEYTSVSKMILSK